MRTNDPSSTNKRQGDNLPSQLNAKLCILTKTVALVKRKDSHRDENVAYLLRQKSGTAKAIFVFN